MPCTNSLTMLRSKPCVIPTISPRAGECSISALQLKKGLKRDETTYLAMLRWDEIEEVSGPLPKEVKVILNDFEDVMPDELPKKLPPIRAIDHEIELVAGTKLPARAPYRMSQPELAELRKQLTELLDAGLITPAKSPYGVATPLMRKADSRVAINIGKKIRKALTKDPVAQQQLKLIESGYAGGERTLALLQQGYYWPQMGDEVQEYVKTCLTCQQDKVERKKKAGLQQPLPVPKRSWESVSLDFITGRPKVEDLGTILVFVDRFNKYVSFIATSKYCSAEDTTQLFFKYVVKYWDMPQDIVSDRDSCFTGNFWTELFKLFGCQLSMSSRYHPESDGQTELFNSMLEEYLRHFVSAT
ncbi:hypothetical protein RJ639_044517 [Escallonia herrerae]|uniref:Integrase catalytic domain-containing protein n=1 Tax=Escallonia herrerae TaxID=1293975 RepID=A0AA89B1I3_9ASTE|nr:hypothetical protein RJ639_044517 [Escallonia herrerae]